MHAQRYREDPDTGCWIWLLYRMPKGYGKLTSDGRTYLAHRWYYEQANGPIPKGLQLDHLCRNRACVNPAHLEPVTARENILRGISVSARYASRTHCKNGHELTPENTINRSEGGRRCRICQITANRRYREKQ